MIVVRPLSNSEDDLKAAVQMAHEWGERPFDESKARENLPARGDSEIALLALRNNQSAGMLRGMTVHLWNESEPSAFAPLVWTRGVCENGGQVPSESRERAGLSLARELSQWAREKNLGKARALFRAGMTPDPKALAAMGMRREFRVFIRRFPLPGDPVSGRVRWFSTERREAKGEEMNLPLEKMFPELFADSRRPPPPTRRLRMSDWETVLETVRASHLARKSAFSESDFYGLFQRAVSRRGLLRAGDGGRGGAGLRGFDRVGGGASLRGRACFARDAAGMGRGRGACGAADGLGFVAGVCVLVGAEFESCGAGCSSGGEVWR